MRSSQPELKGGSTLTLPRFVGLVGIDGTPLRALIAHFRAHFLATRKAPARLIAFPKDEPQVAVIVPREACIPAISALEDESGSFVLADGNFFEAEQSSPEVALRRALALLEEEGPQGCNRLLSQASLIHWSAKRRRLLACRHQFGFAPIFFTLFRGKLLFAPEQSSLLSLPLDRSLDLATLDFFLANGYAPAPLTFLKSIRKLPAGNALHAEPSRRAWLDRYYVPPIASSRRTSKAQRRASIKRLLTEAVDRRRGPGEPGVLLSAGVDSALILAVLSRELGVRSEAFTFRYSDYDGPFNEEIRAKEIAAHFGAKHHVISCGPTQIAEDLPRIIGRYGEPFTYGLHSFEMRPLQKAGVARYFSGGGADCLNIDDSGFASIWYGRLPRPLKWAVEQSVALAGPLAPALKRRAYPFLWSDRTGLPTSVYPAIMIDDERRKLYADRDRFDLRLRELHALLWRKVARFAGQPPPDLWRYVDMQTFSAEAMNLWISAWARSHELSIVDPYFDLALTTYVMEASHLGFGKRYFRELAATMMPRVHAYRRKIPQTIPIGVWLRGPLIGLLHERLTPHALGDIFDMTEIRRLADAHMRGDEDRTWTLWALIAFSAWRTDWLTSHAAAEPEGYAGKADARSLESAIHGLTPSPHN